MRTIALNRDAKATIAMLFSDANEACNLLKRTNETQFARRTFVRTLFSFVEGYGRCIRSAIMDSDLKNQLDASWYPVLQETMMEPEKNGKLKSRDTRPPFPNLFAATIRAWATLTKMPDEDISTQFFGDNGWNNFLSAIAIRHALTHPKLDDSLIVTDDNLDVCYKALAWMGELSFKLLGVSLEDPKQDQAT